MDSDGTLSAVLTRIPESPIEQPPTLGWQAAVPSQNISVVSDFTGAPTAVGRAVDQFGRRDIRVSNAGIIGTGSDLAMVPETELHRTLAVRVVGTIGTIRVFY